MYEAYISCGSLFKYLSVTVQRIGHAVKKTISFNHERATKLLPQGFVLPSTGEAHHGRLHTWIFCQKRFEVLDKCVLRIDTLEPIGNAAETWIELV